MQKPNILYLHVHDTGRCIEPYGYPVHTPNMMRLAETGVMLRNCYCVNPTCSPSRSALLTGQYPHSNGMIGLSHRGFSLKDPNQHIAAFLRNNAGYKAYLSGIQHVIEPDRINETGYEKILDAITVPERPDDHYAPIARGASEWLKSGPAQPFFLDVGMGKPHMYRGPAKDSRWSSVPSDLPNTANTRRHTARTYAGIEAMDLAIGEVIDTLEESGLSDNTIVICTTDHGLAFPNRKCNLTDGGLGVFAFVKAPKIKSGVPVDALVSHVDFFPTLCELANIKKPNWLQGTSFLALLSGEIEHVNEAIFAQINYHAAYQPERCVRTDRYKYIKRFNHRNRRVLSNCDDSESKSLLLEHGWGEEILTEEVLYDTILDPGEKVDISETNVDVLAEMRDRLKIWMEKTSDPLQSGYIEPPDGARINDVDSISPQNWTWQRRPNE